MALALLIASHASAQPSGLAPGALPYCPSSRPKAVLLEDEDNDAATVIQRVPHASLSDVLLNGDADLRLAAAQALPAGLELIPLDRRGLLQTRLIAALSDPNIHVREWVALMLRRLGTPEGEAALAHALADADITDTFFGNATGRKRPLPTAELNASTFSLSTVAAVSAFAPNFLDTLAARDQRAVRELIASIERSNNPDTTPVLVWLLAHGDVRSYGGLIIRQLMEGPDRARPPVGQLIDLLATSRPDHRLAIVQFFARMVHEHGTRAFPSGRERIIAALIGRVGDPNIDVSTEAARALGRARATDAVGALVLMLDRPDVTGGDASIIIEALASINRREALPTLERCARSARAPQVRESAAVAFIGIAKPADPSGEIRRLLWEAPDTALEYYVLAQGRRALHLALRALAWGDERDERAAAALLGWFPDVSSITHILAALPKTTSAVIRNQLLFDLNMILLAEGSPPDVQQRNTLAAEHLRWLYEQIATQPVGSEIRTIVLRQNTMAVFPDRVDAPFSVALSTRSWGTGPEEGRREFSMQAARSDSPQAFLDAVAKDGCGVAFHAIAVAKGVARVATTLYLPRGRIANQVWIGLYRNEGGRWVPLQIQSRFLSRSLNDPNILPTINRDYGADHPLNILRLDLTMERVRVDSNPRHLQNENIDIPGRVGAIDESYAPLLERYKRSDSPSVRYAAEFELVRLGAQPDLQLWLDTLAQHPGTHF